ncbi:hypothetical protein VSVS12_03034 [Vibrio scophthalmi]|nr:hypothetical protein VSVS12_03034 [Vibrio scophthalmi]
MELEDIRREYSKGGYVVKICVLTPLSSLIFGFNKLLRLNCLIRPQ